MDKQTEERLKREAEFQDKRTESIESGAEEARSKFYYLMENAVSCYESTLFDTDQSGEKIVVVGCSTGSVTPLARLGGEVIGIDISTSSINSLNKAIKEEGLESKASAVIMNAEDLDFDDNSIDTICCSGVLHHLEVEKSIKSWAKVLKAGGRIRMIEPMALNPLIAFYRYLTPSMRTVDEHPLKPKDIKILRDNYQEVEIKGFVLTSLLSLIWAYLPNIFDMRAKSYNTLENLDKILLKLFPFLIYLCWAAVIEVRKPIK